MQCYRTLIVAHTLALGMVALGITLANAEVFLLKSGGRIEGEHLNPKRDAGQPYHLRTEEGVRVVLAEDAVHRVIVKSDLEEQYEALLHKVANTVEDQWKLAEWCKEAGLTRQRERHLLGVIAIDPDHEEARTALGYNKFGSRWLTQEEYMLSQGYVRYKGSWRLKQEVELDARDRQRELAMKDWRRKIRIWFDQLGTRRQADALRQLNDVDDPLAAPALSEILADAKQPRSVRIMCLEMLAKLPPGLATATLVKLAMDDASEDIRDKCLDELARQGPESVAPMFLRDLKSKRNERINRAALCLERLGAVEATLPLIDSLVTEHEFIINAEGGGAGGTPINFNAGGGPGQGGLGGLNVGSKAKRVKTDIKNKTVLAALTYLNPGVNFHFDVNAWKRWYIETHTTTDVNLRRDE